MIYLPHRVSGGIVESACATCGSTRLVRSCAFDRMIDEEIKNRSNDPQLPDIGIRSGTACCGADHPSGPSGSLRDIPSVPAFRPACRSPEKHPAVPVRLLPRTLSPLPITRPRPQTAGPNAIAGTGTAPDAIPRTAVSSPGAATSGRRRHPFAPPETNTARKHRRSTVPQPPDAACPPFGPRNEHRPKTQTRHRSAAPPKKRNHPCRNKFRQG